MESSKLKIYRGSFMIGWIRGHKICNCLTAALSLSMSSNSKTSKEHDSTDQYLMNDQDDTESTDRDSTDVSIGCNQ